MKNNYPVFFLLCYILTACDYREDSVKDIAQEDLTEYLFQQLDPMNTGVSFSNNIVNNDSLSILTYRNFYNGGGVGIIDINNDGLKDIFFAGNQVSNKLYLNLGNFKFKDITLKAGVEGYGGWSTGVCVVDINQDGYKDLYIGNAYYTANKKPFNELFINNGDSTFTEMSKEYGLDERGFTTHASFFDYDGDGDLDVYILNNSFLPVNAVEGSFKREQYESDINIDNKFVGGGDKLLRNDNGKFVDVTKKAGIYGSLIGFGLGVTVGDLNNDNLPDIFVANDFFERDYLYINQGDGTFKESVKDWMKHLSLASMGADMADINNDGYPEIFTTEMLPGTDALIKQKLQFENYNTFQLKLDRDFYYQYMQNTLQLNTQNGSFSEIAWYAGVAQSDWSWGALIFDGDMDGHKDIFVCNGVYQDVTDADFMDFFANDVVQKMVLTGTKEKMQTVLEKMPINPQINKYFRNKGDLRFEAKEEDFGLGQKTFSNGAAYADLDNDGDLDLIINNLNQPSLVYRNNSSDSNKHFISMNLNFQIPNIDAIGSQVTLHVNDQKFYQQLIPSRGFQSSVDYTLNFGLGEITKIDSVSIIWPNNQVSSLKSLEVDSIYSINYTDLQKSALEPEVISPKSLITERAVFAEKENKFKAHKENEHVDYYHEGLVIKMLSREGQVHAVGDLNNNGKDDMVLGGALGQPTYLYLQQENGNFREFVLTGSEDFEDTAIHLFDANGDGLTDLFIGSGGNQAAENDASYKDRLYINKGKGNFEENSTSFGDIGLNTACALSFDYDNDGDLDLFIGSRSIPQNYGSSPSSFLFENDGTGNFTDMTLRRARDLESLGMVTDAKLGDITGDGDPELVVVGEWMGIEVLEINGKQLKRIETNLSNYKGWWNTIEMTDIDGDGQNDLVLGNRGNNFFFEGSPEAPTKLWLYDFDGNNDVEKIITQSINGKDKPIAPKKELTGQVPSLRKQNLKYQEYAEKSIQDLFSPELINSAEVKEANLFSSVVAINKGNLDFEMLKLPKEAQFSSIHAIHVQDFNNDGRKDLFLAGNDTHFIPQFSKLDANEGLLLYGTGNGSFITANYKETGVKLRGDIKQISEITIHKERHLLVTGNNQQPKILSITKNL